jgi:dipeptidyl aminopeptidase/acylaminoacyl peptidase
VPYSLPDPDIVPIADTPPPPMTFLAPGGHYLALVHVEAHPPVGMLARDYLPLAGLRIDPVLAARRRLRRASGVSVIRIADGGERALDLPAGAQVGAPTWAPDGRRLAFMLDRKDGIGVWVADAETGEAHEVPGLTVGDVLGGDPSPDGGTIRWSRDGRSLLVLAAPASRQELPEPATEPRIEETSGKRAQVATYQDLLTTQLDWDRFEALATTIACRVDPVTGERTELGQPALYVTVTDSPDGNYLLVHRLQRPFSFRVPSFWFARRVEVRDAAGAQVAVIADLPVSEEVPRHGVPAGPRMVSWEEGAPASLIWTEALDGGDPTQPAAHRDRLFQLPAPFTGAPQQVRDMQHRCLGWYDLNAAHQVMVFEHDRDRRWITAWQCGLAEPGSARVVFDRSVDDAYHDPGSPLMSLNADGTWTMLGDGNSVYLRGDGASPEGMRPFFDLLDLRTLGTTRLHASPPGGVDYVLGFALGGREEVVIWHESPEEPPNLILVKLGGGTARPLTSWPHPHPELSGSTKQLVIHDRGDGVMLSGVLHLPPGYQAQRDGRLPLVVWAYPYDFGSADTAGQVRADSFEFTRLTALGPVVFALRGYAVLEDATMPVIGDPETMNDTYLDQITAAARAHIKALDEAGIIDPARVAVGGHSYGGFMTANLLAHTEIFAAGIARSGAYNRTLTPFGFQTERRSFWEAPEVYDRVSPFRHADRITSPLLLIHGEKDQNSGTYPLQSERLFQAIQGNGGTARLVILPHEGHGYLARESVLHVLAEEFGWLERWLKAAATHDSTEPAQQESVPS